MPVQRMSGIRGMGHRIPSRREVGDALPLRCDSSKLNRAPDQEVCQTCEFSLRFSECAQKCKQDEASVDGLK